MPSVLLCTSTFPPLPHLLSSRTQFIRTPSSTNANSTTNAISGATSTNAIATTNRCLLKSYTHAGLMHEARLLFDAMPERTPVLWTILMSGYTVHGLAVEALSLFRDMIKELSGANLQPDAFIFSVGLKACASIGGLDHGRQLHCASVKFGHVENLFVANALVTMYASCSSLRASRIVFEKIQHPDLVSWSSMLSGFVKNGREEEAMRLFAEMAWSGLQLDTYVLSTGLKAAATCNRVDYGVQIHCYMIKIGFASSLFLGNSLMEFYGRIGELAVMRKVFDKMFAKDLVSWNTIISCHARSVCREEALTLFHALTNEGSLKCDEFTIGSILQVVTALRFLNHGREIHGYVIRAGFGSNGHVISALLDMYIKCMNCGAVPVKLFRHFQSMGADLDEFIVASLLKSCASHQDLETGKMVHSWAVKLGTKLNSFVISSLIDMYTKCGVLDASLQVFKGIEDPGTVAWSAIIAGYCWNGKFGEALKLFRDMQLDQIRTNEFTYTSAILACITLTDLRSGKEIHCHVIRNGYDSNASVVNTLINLYLEFGLLQRALKLCTSISEEKIYWCSLIQAFGRVEDHGMVLKFFHKAQQSYGQLDHKSACYVLNSCGSVLLLNVAMQAHAYFIKRSLICDPNTSNSLINTYSKCGMIEHATNAFNQMSEKCSASWSLMISANVDHGQPSEALDHFKKMIKKNKSPDSKTFFSVLQACSQMGLVDEAFHIFESMVEVYKINPSAEIYSSMAEALSRAGMLREAKHFVGSAIPFELGEPAWRSLLSSYQTHGNSRLIFRTSRLSSSWIETRGNIIQFTTGEIVSQKVSTKLMEVGRKMEELGYVADNNHWLKNSEGYHHTELVALAYGHVCLPQGTTVRVFRSIRMCRDCHSACKFISTFIGREIVIKDSCKFHHFKNGRCSCMDKW